MGDLAPPVGSMEAAIVCLCFPSRLISHLPSLSSLSPLSPQSPLSSLLSPLSLSLSSPLLSSPLSSLSPALLVPLPLTTGGPWQCTQLALGSGPVDVGVIIVLVSVAAANAFGHRVKPYGED